MSQASEKSTVESLDFSIYDLDLKSLDGNCNILNQNKGKVTMLVNVTGECANSPQYTVIQDLYNEYKNLGFEVVATPSVDFCQDAYGEFSDSNASAEKMKEHMEKKYEVDLPFSEMVNILNENCELAYYKHNGEQHFLYKKLQENKDPIHGNFEKFIFSRDGYRYVRFCNSDLLDMALKAGERDITPEQALINIKNTIEYFLKEDDQNNNN